MLAVGAWPWCWEAARAGKRAEGRTGRKGGWCCRGGGARSVVLRNGDWSDRVSGGAGGGGGAGRRRRGRRLAGVGGASAGLGRGLPGSLVPTHSRFGAGHTLTLRVPADRHEGAMAFVVAAFPGAGLREAHGGRLRFQLPQGGLCTLAHVFGELAAHGSDHGVEDFSVSQTTLEEVTTASGWGWRRAGAGALD